MCSERASADTVTTAASTALELDDIQFGMLHQRPTSYVGTYLLLRIDNREAGRKLVQRLLPVIESARSSSDPARNAWVSVTFTYQGLKALGVPQTRSTASRRNSGRAWRPARRSWAMSATAARRTGRSRWEARRPTSRCRWLSPDAARLESLAERARHAHEQLAGCRGHLAPGLLPAPDRAHLLRLKDGIGQPAVEGSGIPGSNPDERPIKAGEFILDIRTRPEA